MRHHKSLFLKTFLVFGFSTSSLMALPSAQNLLQNVQNQTHVGNNTQHLVYQTSTVIQKPGQGPTTMVQTTEIYRQKPNYFKLIINNNLMHNQMISVGDGYLYVQDATGKYQPVKAPFPIDPFQDFSNSVTNFASADTQAVTDATDTPGGHYEVTVRGGKLPPLVDHAMIKLDPTGNTITHMDGRDANGKQVLLMDATYTKMGNTYYPQHMHTESHTEIFDVSSDMNVTTNVVDQAIPVSVFSIK